MWYCILTFLPLFCELLCTSFLSLFKAALSFFFLQEKNNFVLFHTKYFSYFILEKIITSLWSLLQNNVWELIIVRQWGWFLKIEWERSLELYWFIYRKHTRRYIVRDIKGFPYCLCILNCQSSFVTLILFIWQLYEMIYL
jgi:hypothetical protein